jgi:hypothetical protein
MAVLGQGRQAVDRAWGHGLNHQVPHGVRMPGSDTQIAVRKIVKPEL